MVWPARFGWETQSEIRTMTPGEVGSGDRRHRLSGQRDTMIKTEFDSTKMSESRAEVGRDVLVDVVST